MKNVRKFWRFTVKSAHHLVYNTDEIHETRIDLFYDDDSCKHDGRMKAVKGLEMIKADPDRDTCVMSCVKHDETLGERIKYARFCLWDGLGEPIDLSGLDFSTDL